jgi:3-keto-5-aminohexanoate cleavage enzyme
MTGKLIAITVAPNGGRSRTTNQFFVPETPEEIAQEAVDCREAGASCFHFHARDENGANSTDHRLYEKAIKLIRERSDILIQTTNGVGDRKDPATGDLLFPTDEQRFPLLHLDPEPDYYGAATASYDFYHPDGYYLEEATFVNSARFVKEYIKQVYKRRNGQIEWEVFGPHSLHRLRRILVEEGIDPAAPYMSLLFPYIPMIYADFRSLMYTIDEAQRLFPNAIRVISAAGERQFRAMAFGIANDFDGIRVGFESSRSMPDNSIAPRNSDLVKAAVDLARSLGRQPATPAQARALFKIDR